MQKQLAVSARAFLNEPSFEFMVQMASMSSNDWHIWQDEDGNQWRIKNNRRVYTIKGKSFNKTNDIFRFASPDTIEKNSCWAISMPDLKCFLGNDKILRVCVYDSGKWVHNVRPAYLGYYFLRFVANNISMQEKRVDIEQIENFPGREAWMGPLNTSRKYGII